MLIPVNKEDLTNDHIERFLCREEILGALERKINDLNSRYSEERFEISPSMSVKELRRNSRIISPLVAKILDSSVRSYPKILNSNFEINHIYETSLFPLSLFSHLTMAGSIVESFRSEPLVDSPSLITPLLALSLQFFTGLKRHYSEKREEFGEFLNPSLDIGGGYSNKKIMIEPSFSAEEQLLSLIHEITHYFQEKIAPVLFSIENKEKDKYLYFLEGHASTLPRIILEKLAEEDEKYRGTLLLAERFFHETLKEAYLDIEFAIKNRREQFRTQSIEAQNRRNYVFGSAFFFFLEEEHSSHIYGDILRKFA